MIAGYGQSGFSEEALHLFIEMKRDGGRLNRSTFTCVLSVCSNIAALELGNQLHGQLVKVGFEAGCFVGNALLAMYCKCGSVEEAYHAFEEISDKDVVSWNTMIAGYSRHGFGKEALMLFESMKTFGVRPDDVTLVGVLSACSHTGLVDRGTELFNSMKRDYGEKAAEVIFELEPDNAGMYVLLSNLYAASGRWHDVSKMRLKMRDKGVKKVTGFSWLEVQNKIHTFSVGDTRHPERGRIYAYLEELELRMKKDGYVHTTKLVLHDVGEEEKEHMLRYHSEKLAVAYGILSIPAGRPIRVIKNLRVCEDCHNAIKHISKIENRVLSGPKESLLETLFQWIGISFFHKERNEVDIYAISEIKLKMFMKGSSDK
ncbi:hypothetical protein Q3G72_030760 [Acer saccharum]|nr:hypothetical protein Q3G72_030760 [Acer saccharum]